MSAIDAILILCFFEILLDRLSAILPSSFMTSHITELGFKLDILDMSIEASV